MHRKVRSFIESQQLPQPPARLLVALSGGADSVALLLVLRQLGYVLEAAHVNFHLRGAESDADEQFVRHLCRQLEVPLHVQHFATREVAAQQGVSIEMAARRLRYAWFEQLLDATGCEAVAVAHHRDDNAETLLLNLCRGTGLHGLTGMRACNGRVVRPLLDVSRQEILQYLQTAHQAFVIDSTNADTHYRRNFVRGEVLPLLQQLNPSIADTLHATARRMQEYEWLCGFAMQQLRQQMLVEHTAGTDIDVQQLQRTPVAHTLLHEWLSPLGFSAAAVERMAQPDVAQGACFEAEHYLAVMHRGMLQVRRRPIVFDAVEVSLCGEFRLPDGTCLEFLQMPREALHTIPRTADVACVDLDKLQQPLRVRSVQVGDRFRPFGMQGTRLVSDYLTDRHRSRIEKMAAKVLTDAQGILWLVGERPDARVALDDNTRRVLLITWKPGPTPHLVASNTP